MKSILIISNLYAPVELGGYEILAAQVCEDLVARGYRVVVLTAVGQERVHRGVEIWPRLELTQSFDSPDNRSACRRWQVHRRNQRATAAAIVEMQADATLCFSLRRLTLGPVTAIEESTVPRLFVMNDAWPLSYRPRPHSQRLRSRVAGWFERVFLSFMTTRDASLSPALVLSHSLKDELVEGGLPRSNAKVVHQGVSTDLFRPERDSKDPSEPVRLLYAGQLHGYKGVHHVLEAMTRLEKLVPTKTLSLTIAGKGDPAYTARLHKAAKRLVSNVRFVGHVPFAEMPELYRDHEILVFPSIWNEPLGLSHLEAMASGLPAVVATAGGCRELIERCPHIVPYTAGDAYGLAQALIPLVGSHCQRQRVGKASRRWVVENASLGAYIDRIEEALMRPAEIAATAPMMPILIQTS